MRIVNFGQVVDLENGQGMINQFTVLTNGGERVSIVTDAETLNQLVELATLASNQLPESLVEPDVYTEEEYHTTGVPQGQYEDLDEEVDPGETYSDEDGLSREAEPVMGAVAEEYVPAPPGAAENVQGLGAGTGHKMGEPPRQRQPLVDEDGFMVAPTSRTVQADAKGYPMVPGAGVAQEDPDEQEDDGDGIQI